MPNYIDPQVLLWNPELLWPQYLLILDEWEADPNPDKIDLDRWGTPAQLGTALEIFTEDPRWQTLKLRWQILFLFGYAALKRYYQWSDEVLQSQLDQAASGSQELGDLIDTEGDDGPGFVFSGLIEPD